MHNSHRTRLVSSLLATVLTFYAINGFRSLAPPAVKFWVGAALGVPAALLILLLLVFFAVQLYDTFTKDGFGAALALTCTSFMIFPIATVLEAIENIVFPPQGFPRESEERKQELVLGAGQFAQLEGVVYHLRTEQAINDFRYRVNYTLVPLDNPPSSFEGDYLTAKEVRAFANTDGPVLLLTDLKSVGYHQNPISVYYCYTLSGDLSICVAEVTNTPWGEKVHFAFEAGGDVVPKSMHVSPFVDMNRCWKLEASVPAVMVAGSAAGGQEGARFKVSVRSEVTVTVTPNCSSGSSLNAVMKMRARTVECVRGDWLRVQDYFMPQRVALRIYWQALVLIAKGVR